MTFVENVRSHEPVRMNASHPPVADFHRTARADAKRCRPFPLFCAHIHGGKSK